MSTLMQAHRQWSNRPADERFVSLVDMKHHFEQQQKASAACVVRSCDLSAAPADDRDGLSVEIVDSPSPLAPTHWSFGQLSRLAGAPAEYLRTLPAPKAADNLNYGLHHARRARQVGLLKYQNGGPAELRAVTGPTYGRVWNLDVVSALIDRFGDGVAGQFRVPGEFGRTVVITKSNTTLFAGDRDMFVFLADEEHRIELPNRRDGQSGSLARGFFVWNSEVGKCKFGVATFLFDYVCSNRIVWGAEGYAELSFRHTARAPERFVDEIAPALDKYAKSSASNVTTTIEGARSHKIHDVAAFLANRYGQRVAKAIQAVHMTEEQRPIETRWDAVTAVTAYARSIEHQDQRVEIERGAGELLAA